MNRSRMNCSEARLIISINGKIRKSDTKLTNLQKMELIDLASEKFIYDKSKLIPFNDFRNRRRTQCTRSCHT